jgi:hypothetical protein
MEMHRMKALIYPLKSAGARRLRVRRKAELRLVENRAASEPDAASERWAPPPRPPLVLYLAGDDQTWSSVLDLDEGWLGLKDKPRHD